MLTGIGWGQVFLSVDRLSRTGKNLVDPVYPSAFYNTPPCEAMMPLLDSPIPSLSGVLSPSPLPMRPL